MLNFYSNNSPWIWQNLVCSATETAIEQYTKNEIECTVFNTLCITVYLIAPKSPRATKQKKNEHKIVNHK